MASKQIVCFGGGIGTKNLLKGLKKYTTDFTVVTSMADDGGSSGRLKRLYGMLPPGDIISCMASVGSSKFPEFSEYLTFRFPGDRYGDDSRLEGHKLGNLILSAIFLKEKDFVKSIQKFQQMFDIAGTYLPDTLEQTSLSAKIKSGKIIEGEENIELGKYRGDKVIEKLYLNPSSAKACPQVIHKMKEADALVVGPGDLYSNNISVLLVKEIANALISSKAKKFLIIDVANKAFEAKNYSVSDYMEAFNRHLNVFPFQKVFVNNNFSVKIPHKFRSYEYVKDFGETSLSGFDVIRQDFLDENFPLYHDSSKLAKAIAENI